MVTETVRDDYVELRESMAGFGATREQIDRLVEELRDRDPGPVDGFEVDPGNWKAWLAFCRVCGQWDRDVMSGRLRSLKYDVVLGVVRLMVSGRKRRLALFDDVRLIEIGVQQAIKEAENGQTI